MDIRSSLANQTYQIAMNAAKPAIDPVQEQPGPGFLQTLATNFVQEMQANEDTVTAGLTGAADAHSVVEALAATELAVETAVTVRDKVVEAYQEILRMPV